MWRAEEGHMEKNRSLFLYGPVLLISLVTLLIHIGPLRAQDRSKIEIVPTLGHLSGVTSVAFSPDGGRVLSGGSDNTIKLWEVATGALIRTFEGHSAIVASVAFSPDGTRVLSGGWDKTIKLWDTATGALIRTFEGHSAMVTSVAFSPDGGRVLSGGWDNTIKLWEVATGALIHTFEGHSRGVSSVAFSPDATRVLSGGGDWANKGELKLWDVATGALIRTFEGHSAIVASVAFSPDGTRVLSGGGVRDNPIKLWDAATGALIRTFQGHSSNVTSVAFSPDGARVLSGSLDIKLWNSSTGALIRTFQGHSHPVTSMAFSPDGARVLSGSSDIKLWDATTGGLIRTFEGHSAIVASVAFSPDGGRVLSGGWDKTIKLWDAATGALIRTFEGHSRPVTSVAFSPDGTRVLSGGWDKTIKLWDTATGALIRTFEDSALVTSVAFSPDGTRVLSGGAIKDNPIKLWDAATGALIRTFAGYSGPVRSVAFSPDGGRVLSGSEIGYDPVNLWDAATGALIRTFKGHDSQEGVGSVAFSSDGSRVLSGSDDKTIKLWDAATGALIRTFEDSARVWSVAFSPDGTLVLSGGEDKTIKLWDTATGALIRAFAGHSTAVWSVTFSPDGARVLSGSSDGTVRIWTLATGERLVSLIGGHAGEWLTLTPAGFFATTRKGTELLSIVEGLKVTAIDQVWQSLFNPDLVLETLAGDPEGEVREAAKFINLEKVLDSGPAPVVAITSLPVGSESAKEDVAVKVRITDKGKGIGRIEWRVNGVTAAVGAKPPGAGPDYNVSQQLALDPGENTVEVVAYNGTNLLASVPAHTMIRFTGAPDTVKPMLHVLAIGINRYVDQGWIPPGSPELLAFPPLRLAVSDAKDIAAALQEAGRGQYAAVRVTQVLDTEATLGRLQQTIERMAAEINPRDTFVLFAAAHGTSHRGRYYMIPQDYNGGPNPTALQERAISQDRLQDWIANRIKAKKAIILLDTCESGALVGGYTRSRTDVPASEAAVGRLHEATGRPVLTAAAEGKPAFEGYEGHGVFTWTLLDALKNGDRNGNGFIELSELVAHVQDQVPRIAAKLNGRGRAAVAARGSTDAQQSAHFGSLGEDFSLVRRLQ
jgi:WD40 repeat protein